MTQTALRRVVQLPPAPELPQGFAVDLPGRGSTFVVDIAGPAGAPTLFLIHGLACTAYLNWFPALEALRGKYRIVMMDLRGHGRGLPSGRFLRLRDCADDAVAVADALGIDTFIPVGYSMGGPVAQLIWKHHGSRVEGLVLCATARNFRGSPAERLFFLVMPLAAASVALRTPHPFVDAGVDPSDLPKWAWNEFRSTSPWTMLQGVNAIGQFSSHRWIGDVDVPTAVVLTTRDSFIPLYRQLRLANSIPGATLHYCNANHAACVLNADRFVPSLTDAIDSVVSRLSVAAVSA